MEAGTVKHNAVLSLLIANLATTIFLLVHLFMPTGTETNGLLDFEPIESGQYTLYIGTNDKDTYDQIIPTAKAVEIVNDICAKHVDGYTMHFAKGGWVDENGVLTQENTLVYSIAYANEEDVIAIMDEVIVALGQNSILVEKRDISSVFYNG